MPEFRFDFEVTTADRLRALSELEPDVFGMRPLFRVGAILLSAMWFFGGLTAFVLADTLRERASAVFGIVLGGLALHHYGIQPWWARRVIRRDPTRYERVLIHADDARMQVTVVGDVRYERTWDELDGVAERPGWVHLRWSDGHLSSIPDSAFRDPDERFRFAVFAEGRRIMSAE